MNYENWGFMSGREILMSFNKLMWMVFFFFWDDEWIAWSVWAHQISGLDLLNGSERTMRLDARGNDIIILYERGWNSE